MASTGGSSKKREKKGLLVKAVERLMPMRSKSMDTKAQTPSSPRPRPHFWNRSKSTNSASFPGSTKKKEKTNVFIKTLQRSRSVSSMTTQFKFNPTSPMPSFLRRSRSTNRAGSNPAGCFTVCVGPKEERFVVKIACLNHPLFQALLQQAENEFGFAFNGPLVLPCDVEIFREVMLEMDSPDYSPGCNFSTSPYRYGLLIPSTLVVAAPM